MRTKRTRLPLLEIWLVLLLFIAYASVPAGADSLIIWACLLLQYGLLFASIRRPVTIYGSLPTYISAEFLFLFFSYLIFFYPYQQHVLGIYDVSQSSYFPGKAFAEWSNQAIILSSIATLSFRAGLRALNPPTLASDENPTRSWRIDSVTVQALAVPIFALQAILIAIYEFFGWRAAGEGRYSGTATGGPIAESVYLAITILSMVAVALWIRPTSKDEVRRPALLWLSAILSGLWALRILLAGDRNAFLLIAIVTIGGLLTFRLRIGRWVLLPLCLFALLLYSLVAELRSGQFESLGEFFANLSSWVGSSVDRDTSFNISTISVRATLATFPDQFDYGYGIYKLIGFAGIIPFIRGALLPSDMHIGSGDVLTSILLPPTARWGVGSNIIADTYMDFGLLGVPVVLFAVGLGVKFAQNSLVKLPASPWRTVFYLMTLALAAEIPRYPLAFPVRPLLWALLLFWLASVLSPTVNPRARRSRRSGGATIL